ncbi:phosphate ABC transporter permease PstA [Spiroplasma tabanidicola]|uniref:Phosphate ABC transporter permease n=1 Tax=Spiroplasma tabanidicola TaxID=324079 RepID=A0A6I6CE12_9MOLU|nr:phosphate ABC transporter permease PstA [Spiroplasma tabanidicola]QGS52214.1 phosphate ABC transporter permease [Spiroplasma tabanidicola]
MKINLNPNFNSKKLMEAKKKMHKSKQSKVDLVSKSTIIIFTTFTLIILAILISFILYKSVPALKEVGLFKFIFSTIWAPDKDGAGSYGILKIIFSTMVMLFISLLIAVPLTIFCSVFITEYLSTRLKKTIITFVQLLAGIPSVVFGLFALDQIGPLFVKMGAPTGGNMMTASVTLAFMALPTMISLSINALEAVPDSYRFASLGLGMSKERTTYKVVLVSAMPKIITAIITGVARIIGETMAVILIAGNSSQGLNFSEGFRGFIFSSIRTLAGTIGLEMLENHGTVHESALYAIGLVLFFLVIIINLLIIAIGSLNNKKTRKLKIKKDLKLSKNSGLHNSYYYEPYKLKVLVRTYTEKRIYKTFETFIYKFFMILSTSIIVAFTMWIILVVISKGIIGFDPATFIQISGQKSGIFATLLTTLMLIIATIILAIPLALFVAVYLAEYAHKNSKFAKTIRFSINVLASTPSIVFGVFGLSLFVVIFKLPMSIFAASLTMTIVVLPSLITTFEDALTSVPDSYREAAYGMGLSKTKVTLKVVLPNAMQGIITGLILAISRIIGESAPIYLTLGTSVRMPSEGFFASGATLTTEIYMLASEGSNAEVLNTAYELATVTIILVLGLNALSKLAASNLDPNKSKLSFEKKWKQRIVGIFKHNYINDFKKFGKSIRIRTKKWFNYIKFKRLKIYVKNSSIKNKVIKDIVKEAKNNGRNKKNRVEQ